MVTCSPKYQMTSTNLNIRLMLPVVYYPFALKCQQKEDNFLVNNHVVDHMKFSKNNFIKYVNIDIG